MASVVSSTLYVLGVAWLVSCIMAADRAPRSYAINCVREMSMSQFEAAGSPLAHVYVDEYTEYMLDGSTVAKRDAPQRMIARSNARLPDYSSVHRTHELRVHYKSPRPVKVDWFFDGQPVADDPKLSSTNNYNAEYSSGQTDLKIQHPLEKRYFSENGEGPWFTVKLHDGVVIYVQKIRLFSDKNSGQNCVVRSPLPLRLKELPQSEYVLTEGSSFDLSCETLGQPGHADVGWSGVGEPLFQRRLPESPPIPGRRTERSSNTAETNVSSPGQYTCHVKKNEQMQDEQGQEELHVRFRVMSEEFKKHLSQ